MMDSWGYTGDSGPAHWAKWFPLAQTGTHQSPIDIVPGSSIPDSSLTELFHSYSPSDIRLVNTGASWKMDFPSEGSTLSGGPLFQDFKILQMHAHWGDKAGKGSEHTLGGKNFDAEIHIVHYNSKYNDPSFAATQPDGLAVLGIFVKTGKTHPEFKKLCEYLSYIPYKNDVLHVQETIDPTKIIPGDKTYFTYPGSLTTPPFFESVSWIVFKTPIELSKDQLNAMRKLKTRDNEDCACIVNNFRPPCRLGNRFVKYKN